MDIVEKVKQELENAEQIKKTAFKETPERYHHFIIMLSQNTKVESYFYNDLPQEARELGAYESNNNVYVPIERPYMAVDGKLKWFSDEHVDEDGNRIKFNISSNMDKLIELMAEGTFHENMPLLVEIESEKFGHLEGESAIFWGGKGADRTNPIENAKTSALGRAISQAGIGLIGTGVASAEEVQEAIKQQEKLKQQDQKNQGQQNQGSNNQKQQFQQAEDPEEKSDRWHEMKEMIDGDEVKRDMVLDYLKYVDQENDDRKIKSVDDLTKEEYQDIKSTVEGMDDNNSV